MKDLLRRSLAMLMSVVMTLSLFVGYLPAEAFADDTISSNSVQPYAMINAETPEEPAEPSVKELFDQLKEKLGSGENSEYVTITKCDNKGNDRDKLTFIGDSLTLDADFTMPDGISEITEGDLICLTSWEITSGGEFAEIDANEVTAKNYGANTDEHRVTITAHMNITHKDEPQGEDWGIELTKTVDITVKYGTQKLFYYALRPGGDSESGDCDANWFCIGAEDIVGAPDPTGSGSGIVNIEYCKTGNWLYGWRTTFRNGNDEYEIGGTHQLVEFRTKREVGANPGLDTYKGFTEDYGKACYHLDYTLSPLDGNNFTVMFALKEAGEEVFYADPAHSQTVKNGGYVDKNKVPRPGQTKIVDGLTYEFSGWCTDRECTDPADFNEPITANTTFYGKYETKQAKYKVQYRYDGSKSSDRPDEEGTADIGQEINFSDSTIANCNLEYFKTKSLPGYKFASTYPGGSITISADSKKNVITVNFTKSTFIVTYELVGLPEDTKVATPAPQNKKVGATVYLRDPGNEPGYKFTGWKIISPDGLSIDEASKSFKMPGDNVTVRGTYIPGSANYTVKHFTQRADNLGYEERTQDRETLTGTTGDYVEAAPKNYSGFKFNEDKQENIKSGYIAGDGSLELRLYYDRNTHNISYQLAEGSDVPKGLDVDALGETGVKYEARRTVAKTAYAGYEFSGWSTKDLNKDGGEETYSAGASFKMPDQDVTFTGKFTAKTFDVEYVINGKDHRVDKDFPKTETKRFEETVTVADAPACEDGYSFVGWDTTDVEVNNNQFQMPNKKVTLTGSFEPKAYDYTVNYYLGGTEEQNQTTIKVKDSETVSAHFGDQIGLDPNKLPVIEGYTLATTEEQRITIGTDENANVINVYYYKNVTVKAADNGKMFGVVDPALTAAVDESGLVSGDTSAKITFNIPTRERGEDVDTYKITVDGEEIQGYYKVTYEPGVFTIRASTALSVVGTDHTVVYDGKTYGEAATVSGGPTTGVTVEYSTDGGESWSKDFPTVTDVETKTVKVKASCANYETAEDTYTLEVTPRAVLLDGNQETVPYDGEKHSVTGVTVRGVDGEEESGLVGTHTVEGADFAVTDQVNAGTYAEKVDVSKIKIMDNKTDVTANYEVTAGRDVQLTISPLAITIKPVDVNETYNGKEHGAKAFEYVTGSNQLIPGDTLNVSFEGGAKDAGIYTNRSSIGSYTITNATGDVTGNYTVTRQSGDIVIKPRKVTLTSNDASKTYNGEPLKNESVTETGEGFAPGEGVTYAGFSERTNAGDSKNSFSYTAKDGTALTNYSITTVEGTLTVNPASLTVQTMNADRVYNGEALTNGNVVIKLGNEQKTVETKAGKTATVTLQNGETIGIMVTGTQTEAGSSANTAVVSWNGSSNGSFTALESNYILSFEYGQLTVKDSEDEIVVTTTGGVFTYDGLPHRATVAVSELPEGYTLESAESDAVAQTVLDGTVEAKCDRLVIKNAQGEDVTDSLKIRYVNSRLIINPTPLNITTQSATKEYDGEPLTAGVTVTGLVNNETVSVMPTGSQTEVGSSQNGYHIAWVGTAKVYNYDVVETLGTLTVTAVGAPPVPPAEEEDTPDVRVVETLLLEDEIVPLAGGTEKCCILHFLLALLALVTVLVSGHDTKKLQEKITELKKKESPEDGEDDGRTDGRKDDN